MAHRPTLSSSEIPSLVHQMYGVHVTVVRELDSYDDQNFLVKVVSDSTTPPNARPAHKHGYVFKILNSLDSRTPEVIETRHRVILHAAKAGYPTPGLVASLDNQYQKLLSLPSAGSQCEDHKQEPYVVSLLSYLPGQTLDQVPLTTELCYQVGWFAGKLDAILKDFPTDEHPALRSMTRKWNMSEIPELRDRVHNLPSQEQRTVAGEIISLFEKTVLSPAINFSKGIIHGDFNDCNIVVSYDCGYMAMMKHGMYSTTTVSSGNNNFNQTEKSHYLQEVDDQSCLNVNGVFDFGDTTLSLHVFEIAIAIVHVMLNKQGIPAMQAASLVLAGFLEHIKLTHEEISHLKICVCARFVQSLILGYTSIKEDPGNNYILTHATRVWPVLKSLWEMPDSQALAQIMEHVKGSYTSW